MAVSFVAVMFLVVVPAADAALGGRAVWAVFIIVVVHEPMAGGWVGDGVDGGWGGVEWFGDGDGLDDRKGFGRSTW